MKTTLIIILVYYIMPNCSYGQLADTISKKEIVPIYTDSLSKDNFKLSLLFGIGNPQGTRVGFCTDFGGVRVGGGFGMGYSILLAFFYLPETELITSAFIEFPKLILSNQDNLGIGLSYSHLDLDQYRAQTKDYLGIYFFQDLYCSQSTLISLGFGYDRIIYAIPSLHPERIRHALHIDAKLIFDVFKTDI